MIISEIIHIKDLLSKVNTTNSNDDNTLMLSHGKLSNNGSDTMTYDCIIQVHTLSFIICHTN